MFATDERPRPPLTNDQKLDLIVGYLQKMDKRDRLRMVGGTIRGFISIIPIAFIVWSGWYFYAHGTEIIKQITEQTTKSMMGQQNAAGQSLLEQAKAYIEKKK